jgi:hypothetical protein
MQDALALTSGSEPVGIPIFNPRNTVLFPAIAAVDDGEMCVSRVFRTGVREVARSGRGIRRCGPKGAGSHLGGALYMVGGSSPTRSEK